MCGTSFGSGLAFHKKQAAQQKEEQYESVFFGDPIKSDGHRLDSAQCG
jgi:hypothetical protein